MAGGLARLGGALAPLVAVIAIAVPSAAVGQDGQVETQSMEDLAASYEAWRLERAAWRQGSEARAARERSRSAYVGQSAAAALEIARRAHSRFITAPAWRTVTLPEGARVREYLGDHAASVELAGGQRTLVESTMPMRAESDTGLLGPVDLALVDRGGFFEPRTPLADVRLGKDASSGALLPASGIRAVPRSAPTASSAVPVSDKAFYANVAADSDYLALPVAGGFQAAWQLRSPGSPERLELEFELPMGAELQRALPGPDASAAARGLEVVRGGGRLATVSAPVAWDADGEPVPVTYALEGSTLVVSVDHRGGDWLYPLMVDPVVLEDQRYWRTNSGLDLSGWSYTEVPAADRWSLGVGDGWMGRGRYIYGSAAYFGNGEYNATYFKAPGDSHVYQAEFSYVRHVPAWQTLVSEGFWANGGWQTWGWASNQAGWPPGSGSLTPNYSPTSNAGTMDYLSTHHCVSGSNCDPNAGAAGNEARLALWTSGAGNRTGFQAYLGGAAVWINDRYAPSLVGFSLSGVNDTSWYDVKDATATVIGRDAGLGVKQFRLGLPGNPDRYRTHNCAGHRLDRCWRDFDTYTTHSRVSGDSFTFSTGQLPEGRQYVEGFVIDFAGNSSSPASRLIKVDHKGPAVGFSGSLYDRRGTTPLEHGVYRLRTTATDPNSGAATLRVTIDGVEVGAAVQAQIPCDGCSLTAESSVSTYSLPSGEHVVVATATDALGHVTQPPATFKFVTPEGTPCPLNPFVDQPPAPSRPLAPIGSLCGEWPL